MEAKHIIFISAADQFAKNDEYIKTKLVKRWNKNVYSHLFEEDAKGLNSNLVVFFGTNLLFRLFPDKSFGKFFKDENEQMYFSTENYKEYDKLGKKDITEKVKEIKTKVNKYLSRFALVRVTDRHYFYRNIEFKKIKGQNTYRADHKYIEDPAGEFLSFDGKKLKQVPREYQTFDQTYESHLRSKDLFYTENYPHVAHTKLLHYLTFDIETEMSLDTIETPKPIISIAGYSNIYDKNLVWLLKKRPDQTYDKTQFAKDKIFEFDNETEMLTHFFKSMEKLEVDLLGGWNADFYDIPYLLHRSKKIGANFTNFLPEVYETIGKDGEKSYYCHEVILWDYLRYAKWIIVDNKPISWSLDAVAQHLFNEKKIEHEGIEVLWDDQDLTKLLQYNIQDVYLTEKIAQAQKIIEFPLLYQKIAPQTYENVYFNSRFLETLIHQRFKQYKFPSKHKQKGDSRFEGALVLDTKPGLFENVSVYDFSSLYPSIMISLNLSKDTLIEDPNDFDPKTDIKIGDVMFSTKKKGIIPQLSQLLVNERAKLKKRKMQFDGNSQEFKILNDMEMCFKGTSNALYGVLGYRGFILYDQRVASSVTYVARQTLRFTKTKAEELGYNIMTGDSVTTETELILLKNGKVTFEKIGNLWNEEGTIIYDEGKEIKYFKNSILSLTIDKEGNAKYENVPYVMRHKTDKNIYRVHFNNMTYVDVTEDHSLIGYLNNCNMPLKKGLDKKFVEVSPMNLQKIKSIVKVKLIPRKEIKSKNYPIELYELMGLFIGDGSFGRGIKNAKKNYDFGMAGGLDRDEIIEKIIQPLQKKDWITWVSIKKKGDFSFGNKNLTPLFNNEFRNQETGAKQIPTWILDEKEENICAFLRGFFSADGTVTKTKGIRLTNTNLDFIKIVDKLLFFVGCPHSVFSENKHNKYLGKESKTISKHIYIGDNVIFKNKIGFIFDRKNERLLDVHTVPRKKTIHNLEFDTKGIQKIEKIDYHDYVWDIEVDNTHRFFANGVLVHNTDSIFIQIKANSFEENIQKSRNLQDVFNKSLPEFLLMFTKNEKILATHIMQIVFEKSFSKLLLAPAKKKQVGFLKFFKGKMLKKEELYIKGFESVRDDCPTFFKGVLNELYENILNNYGNIEKLQSFITGVKIDLKKQTPIDLVVRKKMSKKMEEYAMNVQHVKAIRNSGVELKRGENVNMLYVKDSREVIHYEPELNQIFEIDYKKYFHDFVVKKIELIDTDIHYKLFLEKTKLVDLSHINIKNRIQKKKAVTNKLG